MSITQSGPVCDVCDKHIFLGFINQFTVTGLYKSLVCCDACKEKVLEMSRSKDWRVLPEGGLRRFYAEMSEQGKVNNDPARISPEQGEERK